MPTEPDIETSTLIDDHDGPAQQDMDDGFSIALYRATDGRHFIYIAHSDMSSKYSGALGFDQWVTDAQIESWKEL